MTQKPLFSPPNETTALKSVLELENAAWFCLDLKSNLKFQYISKKLMNDLGYPNQDLDHFFPDWIDLIYPDDLKLLKANITRHISSHGQYPLAQEIRLLTKKKKIKWLSCKGHLENNENEAPYIIGTLKDIQPIKDTEEKLQQLTTQLIHTNRELEKFAHIASHDLKEPLRTISNYVDIFVDENKNLNRDSTDILHTIQSATLRLRSLIDSLLKYSRISSQKMTLEEVQLSHTFNCILNDLHDQTERLQANIILPTKDFKIQADKDQIYQLFQNLISNALKFSRQGTPPQIEVVMHQKSDKLIISVSDNGIGFDPDKIDMIFLPFHRLHSKQEYEGTGMGLTICQKIVARHSGTLDVQSKLNEGSTFKITFPLINP